MSNQKDEVFYKLSEKLDAHSTIGDIKVLLFGTSIVKHLSTNETVRRESWDLYLKPLGAFNLGMSGDKACSTQERIKHTKFHFQPQLKFVVIHTGSNDASCCYDPLYVANSVKECVFEVTLKNPIVNIIVSSVLPRLKAKQNLNCDIDENGVIKEINGYLRDFCRDFSLVFVENWSDTPPELYYRDGIHLSLKGCKRLSGNISKAIVSYHSEEFITPKSCVVENVARIIKGIFMGYMEYPVRKSDSLPDFSISLRKFSKKHASLAINISKSFDLSCHTLAYAHVSYAAKCAAASCSRDPSRAFHVISVSKIPNRPNVGWFQKIMEDFSSDDTDTEPTWKNKAPPKEKIRRKGKQLKKVSK